MKSDFGQKFSMDKSKTFLNIDSKVVYPGPLPSPKRSPIKIHDKLSAERSILKSSPKRASYKASPERAYKNWHADPIEENLQIAEKKTSVSNFEQIANL